MNVIQIFITYSMAVPASLLIGYLLDLLIGDPQGMWHPVCLIGNMISAMEKLLRRSFPATKAGELAGGFFLVLVICLCSAGLPALVLLAGYAIHLWVGFALQCYMCYSILATKSLKTESMKVKKALDRQGLEAGRKAVSMIVGRDTASLTEEGVIKAAVETVAENTSDGIIAPMLYLAIGGPVLGFLYKGINTMDSMVAYKNEKYLYFGRAAARLDDAANYLPSRISAILMILAAPLAGLQAGEAARIWRRDRRKHASPNSAQTEAVMAGALQVQLAGDAWYFGEKHEKPCIGDPIRPVERQDIVRANRLLYAASALSLAVCILLRLLAELCILR